MRLFTAPVLAAGLMATPAVAGTVCNFNIECYMTEPCVGSGWELVVDMDTQVLSTVFGDLDILDVAAGPVRQITARGDGSLNLLTIGETISFFTTHVAADPATITYVGECYAE